MEWIFGRAFKLLGVMMGSNIFDVQFRGYNLEYYYNFNFFSLLKSFLLEDLERTAQILAKKAVELAFDPDYDSPFALSARRNGINISGGKPDDVTVLLARVSR